MTAKEQLEIAKEISAQIDATKSKLDAVNEKIKGSELGSKRKELNAEMKHYKIALDDLLNGRGNIYDPRQMTIQEYIDNRETIQE